MMTSVQNTFLVIVPYLVGLIQSDQTLKDMEKVWTYKVSFFFLLGILGISFIFTILIYVIDKATTGGILNEIGEKKEKYQEFLNSKEGVKKSMTVNEETTPEWNQ